MSTLLPSVSRYLRPRDIVRMSAAKPVTITQDSIDYVHGLGLISQRVTDSLFYRWDGRATSRRMEDSSRNVRATQVFDAYGLLRSGVTLTSNYGFVGEQGVRGEKGLNPATVVPQNMRARVYEPLMGRFVSRDPVWQPNPYGYVDGNPWSKIDPDGNQSVVPAYKEYGLNEDEARLFRSRGFNEVYARGFNTPTRRLMGMLHRINVEHGSAAAGYRALWDPNQQRHDPHIQAFWESFFYEHEYRQTGDIDKAWARRQQWRRDLHLHQDYHARRSAGVSWDWEMFARDVTNVEINYSLDVSDVVNPMTYLRLGAAIHYKQDELEKAHWNVNAVAEAGAQFAHGLNPFGQDTPGAGARILGNYAGGWGIGSVLARKVSLVRPNVVPERIVFPIAAAGAPSTLGDTGSAISGIGSAVIPELYFHASRQTVRALNRTVRAGPRPGKPFWGPGSGRGIFANIPEHQLNPRIGKFWANSNERPTIGGTGGPNPWQGWRKGFTTVSQKSTYKLRPEEAMFFKRAVGPGSSPLWMNWYKGLFGQHYAVAGPPALSHQAFEAAISAAALGTIVGVPAYYFAESYELEHASR